MLMTLKRHYAWIILIAAVLAQWGFPISSIIEKNVVLASGVEFKIKTRPVDPADPFRGRYVAIGLEVGVPESQRRPDPYRGTYYVRLVSGEDGFAEAAEISRQRITGDGVLKLDDVYVGGDTIRLPYDRYYMQEHAAPLAEAVYIRERKDAYVTLRVKNGVGVVSGLYIEDMPIEDYIKLR